MPPQTPGQNPNRARSPRMRAIPGATSTRSGTGGGNASTGGFLNGKMPTTITEVTNRPGRK